MVSRGGIEPLPSKLKILRFLDDDSPVYPPAYPAFLHGYWSSNANVRWLNPAARPQPYRLPLLDLRNARHPSNAAQA